MIVVTHSDAVAEEADVVLRLDHGKIVEVEWDVDIYIRAGACYFRWGIAWEECVDVLFLFLQWFLLCFFSVLRSGKGTKVELMKRRLLDGMAHGTCGLLLVCLYFYKMLERKWRKQLSENMKILYKIEWLLVKGQLVIMPWNLRKSMDSWKGWPGVLAKRNWWAKRFTSRRNTMPSAGKDEFWIYERIWRNAVFFIVGNKYGQKNREIRSKSWRG